MTKKSREEKLEAADEGILTETSVKGFTILNRVKESKSVKLRRTLPSWLREPIPIEKSVKDTIPVSELLILDDVIGKNLLRSKIEELFPTQKTVIPFILRSHRNLYYRPPDICVSAPTGSGKTLAFVIPIVQILRSRLNCQLKALIILPVLDLARQVYSVFRKFVVGTNLKVALLSGQSALSAEQATIIKDGKSLVDIIVSTPGRLIDHIQKTEGFSLKYLKFLVIDEADRTLGEAQSEWYNHVKNSCIDENGGLTPASALLQHPPQKILLSATLTHDPEILQRLDLFQPKLFSTSWNTDEVIENLTKEMDDSAACQYVIPDQLEEIYYRCDQYYKPLVVYHHIRTKKWKNILCFCNTVDTTQRLTSLLKLMGKVEVKEFSARLKAIERKKILRKFTDNQIDILVCTDSMGRGIDLPNVDFVVSYDPPAYTRNYIHRIGRTARAGRKGCAVTLLENAEVKHFKKILRALQKTESDIIELPLEDYSKYDSKYNDCIEQLPDVLKEEKRRLKNLPLKNSARS